MDGRGQGVDRRREGRRQSSCRREGRGEGGGRREGRGDGGGEREGRGEGGGRGQRCCCDSGVCHSVRRSGREGCGVGEE